MDDGITITDSAGEERVAKDQARPCEVINPDAGTPVLLLCDHASNYIPHAFGNLGLDEAHLARHIAYDIGVAEVTRQLSHRLGATAILSAFSRLIVDPNRSPDADSFIPETGDGVAIPGNQGLSEAARLERKRTYFDPYHKTIEAQLGAMIARGPDPAIISVHSFTPVMNGTERPWQICALWNEDSRLPLPFMTTLRGLGYTVGDNEPYSGRDYHGYTLQQHADMRGLANLLIEIRQDLIDTHHGAAQWTEVLAVTLRDILADPAVYKANPPA